MSATRGTRTACWRALIVPFAATPFRPSDFTALRVASVGLLMMYVPAAYFTPPTVNGASAMLTLLGATFHGRTAERQSPRCRTRIVPDPDATLPSTCASVVSICIGLD